MIITFCGHADFFHTKQMEKKVLSILEDVVGNRSADFYLSHYGAFDHFALHCGKLYKQSHPNISLLSITPYFPNSYRNTRISRSCDDYDDIIYPPLEQVPYKFAISHCNQWMVRQADFIISYINHDWGGAYQTYRYALKHKKRVLNLGTLI